MDNNSENSFLEKIVDIDDSKNYWFVRTESGLYYETFYENNFIAIGCNYVTLNSLENTTKEEIIHIIAKNEQFDLEKSSGKSRATSLYNKLQNFKKLKRGDVIVIPSTNSTYFAFGIINDDNIYTVTSAVSDCDHYKRRKVEWICKEKTWKLDTMFYKIRASRHAISSINQYQSYVDSVMESVYFKGGFGHFNFDVKSNDDINFDDFTNLVESIKDLMKTVNQFYHYNEDVSESYIKLNLQSPGKIQLKLKEGKSLVTLALILSLMGCASEEERVKAAEKIPRGKEFLSENTDSLQRVKMSFNKIDADIDKLKSKY